MNDTGDDWFYDDFDDHEDRLSTPNYKEMEYTDPGSEYEDGMLECEWMEKLRQIHEEHESIRQEEKLEKQRAEEARKAAEERKLKQWAKQDEERRLKHSRRFRNIDEPWEAA